MNRYYLTAASQAALRAEAARVRAELAARREAQVAAAKLFNEPVVAA